MNKNINLVIVALIAFVIGMVADRVWLAAREIETGNFWQANQNGDRRNANLAEILQPGD